MTWTLLLEQLLNGLQFGLMLFLIAAGLTLVFGIMDIMNLAHGSLYMAGAYVAAETMQRTGSFTVAVLVAAVATGVAGVVLELVLIRRLAVRDHLAQVLGSYAVILIANDLVKMVWGPAPVMLNMPAALSGPVQLLPDLMYPAYRLMIIVFGLAAALGLYWFVTRTRAGVLVRAGASNRQMATLMGVRVPLLFLGVFTLGAMLAAVAGALLGPITSVQVGMGEDILILVLVCIVIGGIGSIRGALVGALLVGMVDTAGRAFLPMLLRQVFSPAVASSVGPTLAAISIYVLMAVVLVYRPSGLFLREAEHGTQHIARQVPGPVLLDRTRAAGAGGVPAGGSGAGAGLLHLLRAPGADLRAGRHQPEPHPGLWRHGGAGACGLLRCGAYAVGILAMNGVTSALVAWPAAALLAGLLAAATGAVSLRTRGVYFIMITLAFAQMLFYIFISLRQYGGEDGLNLPGHSVLPGLDLGHDVSFYYVVLALFAVLMAVFGRLVDSRFGKALQGVRENESRMESLGYPVYRLKLVAFVLSGAVAGLAGALLANHNLFISPASCTGPSRPTC